MSMRAIQRLLLAQNPSALIHEQPHRVLQRLEEVLAPAMVPRVPEAGHEQSVGGRLVLPAYLASDDH